MAKRKKKIGILVVAYNAASTLAKVLDRIPDEIRGDIAEVIVSDDHSQDSTYLVGLGYQQISDLPITLIRQPDEPRLRRQPEGRLQPGHRARARHRGHAPRRRPVRAGVDARPRWPRCWRARPTPSSAHGS